MYAGHHNAAGVAQIDLGTEHALAIDSTANTADASSALNARWLIGTVLTGVTSIVLMGGALMASLDGQYTISTPYQAASDDEGEHLAHNRGGKGDRVISNDAGFSNRMIIPVNVVRREGGRDHVRAQPYALVTASLIGEHDAGDSYEIPPFDPIAMYQGEDITPVQATSDAIYGADVEGEVTISQRDFPMSALGLTAVKTDPENNVMEEVKKAALFMLDNRTDIAAIPAYAAEPQRFAPIMEMDFDNLEVRITEENVSFQAMSVSAQPTATVEEHIHPVRKDDVLLDLILDNEGSQLEANKIVTRFKEDIGLDQVRVGQVLRFALDPALPELSKGRLLRVSVYENEEHVGTIARNDQGQFIEAAAPSSGLQATAFNNLNFDSSGSNPTATYYDSIYQTSLENEIPKSLIKELLRIYSHDVDFNSTIRPGDAISVFYGLPEEDSKSASEILFTSLQANGRVHRFYRFRNPLDGEVDYYDENGQSAQQFLLRKPIAGGRFTSGFGMRRHPIHKTRRMHTGVDWAAPRGTPILASGEGLIIRAAWTGGYGRHVQIQHANGYVSTYSHMSRFADGTKQGARVHQGQVIGYVGSSGLSSGNHLHYEVKVNDRFVNPLKIKLPKGRNLEGDVLIAFKRERDRIDALVSQGTPNRRLAAVAQ
ncbi:M23 family metallopeptidase [Pseudovibrio exalbescens]|uniref:M23 family metallopeptidase n=1 Tax=Pseudovibrio exalbescens TaxID=197461 RepID=UPI0023655551|nr:M23 family metallopeptidase [Pseudovibrio exalbescens]MDD7909290.1 M23 family metallopeptidase [Pseudovibrio exalbescens]